MSASLLRAFTTLMPVSTAAKCGDRSLCRLLGFNSYRDSKMTNHDLLSNAPGREPACYSQRFPRGLCQQALICGPLGYCLKDRGYDPYNSVERGRIPAGSYFAHAHVMAVKISKNSFYGKFGVRR